METITEVRELEKKFTKNGETFTQVAYNPDTQIYIYKREHPAGMVAYEVFKRRVEKHFKMQGSYVAYPSDNAFGNWALYIVKYEEAVKHMNKGIKYDVKYFQEQSRKRRLNE